MALTRQQMLARQQAQAPSGAANAVPRGYADDFAPPPPAPGVLAAGAGWARLWSRIPGAYAARSLAIFTLQRSGYRLDPDTVIVRPVILGQRLTAGAGFTNVTWTFDTLTVITGVRGVLTTAGGGTAFQYTISSRAGSDGGYIIGTEQNPAPFTSIWTGTADTTPIPLAPTHGRPNNQWTGQINGDVGINDSTIHWIWYGFGLWQPSGQIQ